MSATRQQRDLGEVRRVVVKVGSAVLAADGELSPAAVRDLAAGVTSLSGLDLEVVLVVSGAVAAGYAPLGWARPPAEVVPRQAAASVGQPRLMAALDAAFAAHGVPVAQLLLSAGDVEDRRRFLSARHTLQLLLSRRSVPVINENDALSDDEMKVGDNDHLAALVTQVASADLLIILSQVEGLLSGGGRGERIPVVHSASQAAAEVAAGTSPTGVGGMAAKVSAALLASRNGVATVIADGRRPGILPAIVQGEDLGTLFPSRQSGLTARKRWIAVRSRSRGSITLDAGACEAVLHRRASVLPSGITRVEGQFPKGSRVELLGPDGRTFAVGLASYDAREVRLTAGRQAREIAPLLGYRYIDAIVHRDDLVLLGAAEPPAGKETACPVPMSSG